jgi:chitin disaccharide deacetylase
VKAAESRRAGPEPVLVVVNADDLGMSAAVNEAIFSLMERGRLTSASILANAPGTDEAIRQAREFPQCSFGAHLNIVEFAPLSRSPGLAGLVDEDGRMRFLPPDFRVSRSVLHAIYVEFRAQIERLLSQGVTLTHLDSHTHVHLRPILLPLIKSLQMAYGIRCIRTKSSLGGPQHQRFPGGWKRSLYNWTMRHVYRSVTTEAGAELSTFVAVGSRQEASWATVEASAHPGNPHYPQDTELLLSRWEEKLRFPVRLVSYRQLAAAHGIQTGPAGLTGGT